MHDCSNEIVFADFIDDDKYRFHFFNPKQIIKIKYILDIYVCVVFLPIR